MASMGPPTSKMTDKILLDKATKFGIKKSVSSGLLKNNRHTDLMKMIEKRINDKTREMEKKTSRMFSNLERELQRQSSLPSKTKKQIIKIQNDNSVNASETREYFKGLFIFMILSLKKSVYQYLHLKLNLDQNPHNYFLDL